MRLRIEAAFTLAEVLVVIVVLGAVAAFATPMFVAQIERNKASEGAQLLMALMGAQKRYALDNNGVYSSTYAALDLTINSPNFVNPPTVSNANPVASITRNGGTYTLSITDTGTITCAVAGSAACQTAGY